MKTKYCLPIIKSYKEEVFKIIKKNNREYNYFEIWLDYIENLDIDFIKDLVNKYENKLIFLLRRKGLATPKLNYKKGITIINALNNSKTYLDLDISQKRYLNYLEQNKIKVKLILSYHNYQLTPSTEKLKEVIKSMKKYKPLIYKISTFCKNEGDNIRLIDLSIHLREAGVSNIILGMGDKGIATRIASAVLGGEMSFTPLLHSEQSALGQLTKKELEGIIKKINLCYFIADPVEHSLSPQMHQAGYRSLGLEKDFLFLRQKVKSEDLKKFIERAKKDINFRGASISIPHKIRVMKYLDEIDFIAKKIGAVNTVVKIKDKLKGYNTDWIGILKPLKETIKNISQKKIAIIGAGGAARAAVYALVSEKGKVTVFNRDIKKAQKLAKYFNCEFQSLSNLNKLSDFDIIIHTTKIGLNPSDAPIIPNKFLLSKHLIFDVVYSHDTPLTKLIKSAQAKKAKTISGIEMLIYQGAAQFELLTGKKIPPYVMRKVIV